MAERRHCSRDHCSCARGRPTRVHIYDYSHSEKIGELQRRCCVKINIGMSIRDPEKNFKVLWETFNKRYPFFQLRNVNWKKQHDTYRSKVTSKTSDNELFEIFCQMLDPLNDGHVELKAKASAHQRNDTSIRKKSPDSGKNSRPERLGSYSKQQKRLLSTIV